MIWKAESQTAYVMDALQVMRERNLSSFEVRPDAQDRYMGWVEEDLDSTVWARGGCQSWYLDDGGRPSLMWPRTMWGFSRMLRHFDAEHYLQRFAREAGQDVEQGEAIRARTFGETSPRGPRTLPKGRITDSSPTFSPGLKL